MKVGVFDSGIGGEAVAFELKRLLPDIEIICLNDHEHMPYGDKPEAEIISLTDSAIQPLINSGCKTIVIACNTATTVAISALRCKYPELKFVGIEPMIKPACQMTKTKNIAVCATPRTLDSKRYSELKNEWAHGIKVYEPDCGDWATLIEDDQAETIDLDKVISEMTDRNVDVVVLGCTHYHWLKQRLINSVGPKVTVLEPSDAIANRISAINS